MPGMIPFLLATFLASPFSDSGSGPALVSAHGGLANYTVGDVWYPGYDPTSPLGPLQLTLPLSSSPSGSHQIKGIPQRSYSTIDPLFSPTSPFLSCNTPGLSPPNTAPHYISLAPGSNLSAIYYYWLHPVGPMSVWLSGPCPPSSSYSSSSSPLDSTVGDSNGVGEGDCTTVNLEEVRWFKIWEAGLLSGPNLAEGMWYQKQFQKWDGRDQYGENRWEVTIPKGVREGRYVVRHEILSLHVAGRPQWYVECGHLDLRRGGSGGEGTGEGGKVEGGTRRGDGEGGKGEGVIKGNGEGAGGKQEGEGGVLPPEEYWVRFPGAYREDDPDIFIDVYSEENANRTEYIVPGPRIWPGFTDINLPAANFD